MLQVSLINFMKSKCDEYEQYLALDFKLQQNFLWCKNILIC